MIKDIREEVLKYDNYLLLQGPKGFFFYRLAKFLRSKGKKVYKINFNGGDMFTYPYIRNTYNYRKRIEEFREYLKKFLFEKNINVILLYGDYKPYHKIAVDLCRSMNHPIDVYIFEEGYVRPNYITLEKEGINGWSGLISKDSEFFRNLPEIKISEPSPVNYRYSKRIISALIHYFFVEFLRWYFPYYRPSKNYFPYFHVVFFYLRGYIRKLFYKFKDRKASKLLNSDLRGKYFLVPLQVHNDTQIKIHSDYGNSSTPIEDFITEVMESFKKNANDNYYLVFKHHPEDRGFKNYKEHIEKLSKILDINDRVFYVHDLHLPSLIKGSIGVVVINSTVGLQALHHNRPVKVLKGKAIYDMPGLTFQGKLDKFWQNPGRVDRELFIKFRNYLIKTCQLNGSFYGRFPFQE